MKSTGIVRKIDELGRIVLPIELRRNLDINIKDPVEVYTDEDKIVLKKYKPTKACQMTGEVSDNNLVLANGNVILSEDAAKELVNEIKQSIDEPVGAH
ncbi:AbrB/MazE/SpoVT family DNA-binding domain-containing protein [Tuberibacillus sp. Marseille-P3662]|uniref:AbrB/MazE/SpoVT family DNA-binding domain-containing protein n=1 Tax=Tuberibacillus sp. Marseille-P3662 TaxID=1965358 RepID=UPI000A1CC937|nr:AbrB/MazE/SpoVT family DNA-binding domain-containing protein [Tuberibacillus sp. Marseille-P3662]